MRRVVVGFTAALLLGFAGPAKSSTNRKSKSTWAAAGFKRSENGAPIFPLAPFRRPAPVFPAAPYTAPAPVFPVAPLAGTARANDSVFPVAPLALGSNQLRPLDDPDVLVAGDPLPG